MGYAWDQWCDFCDRAKVAPDTTLSATELAKRFNEETHNMTTPAWVKQLMVETEKERHES